MSKIFHSIQEIAKTQPHGVAISQITQEGVMEVTYAELVDQTVAFIDFFKAQELENIALFLDNSYQWICIDLAAMACGICLTPIPQFFTEEQISNLMKDAGIKHILTDVSAHFSWIENAKKVSNFANIDVLEMVGHIAKSVDKKVVKITFTSGTTSNPKGVCLTNDNIEKTVFSLIERIGHHNAKNNLILFPLAILLENIAGVYCNLCVGAKVSITSLKNTGIDIAGNIDLAAFIALLEQAQPTSFIITPELLKLLIHLKQMKKITLDKVNFIALGGAVCAKELLVQAQALQLPIYQGYGLSEFASVVSLNALTANKIGSVGKLLSHIDIKIAKDGEILLKGNAFCGYINADYHASEFYQTGDIGYVDDEGYLFISGRKKNVIITSMGRNFSPEWVEGELLKGSLISQCVIFGDGQKKNMAVLVLHPLFNNEEDVKKWVQHVNERLPDYAKVSDFIIASEPFTIENRLLTSTKRVRREAIYEAYQNRIF